MQIKTVMYKSNTRGRKREKKEICIDMYIVYMDRKLDREINRLRNRSILYT